MTHNFESIDDELTCSICLDIFDDPRVLPCAHVFCFTCVKGCIDGGNYKCPICKEMYMCTSADHLRKSFNLANIIRKLGKNRKKDENNNECIPSMNTWREPRHVLDSDSAENENVSYYYSNGFDYRADNDSNSLYSAWQRFDVTDDVHESDYDYENDYQDEDDVNDDDYEDENARHHSENVDFSWITNDEASYLSGSHFQQSFKYNDCYDDQVFEDDLFENDCAGDWGETHEDYGNNGVFDAHDYYDNYDYY